ncbi:hypothetical protein [Spirosoma validum]|uniref:Uncharacterized protein n=1 Tax=Spirosoma validum TaxID=2771355 RepID=A0A927B7I9_9BACT|nr:hypothetical protein [Spirosoma validum]MBD2756597.1 hypothetical protein [Spirosoma validum]
MSSKSENLKVIFYQPAAENKAATIVADGYFSFVPTFKEGDSINITLSRKGASNTPVHDPIGHKTHRVIKTDWVIMIDGPSKEALATLVVSVDEIITTETPVDYPSLVASHS